METNKSNSEKTFSSKLTGARISEADLADMLNESKAVIKSSASSNDYNYLKIAENLQIIAQIIGLNITSELCNEIKKSKVNFAGCKTKDKFSEFPEYSKIKKNVRSKVREYLVNKQISEKNKSLLKQIVF